MLGDLSKNFGGSAWMVAVGELRDLEASLEDLIFQRIDRFDRWSFFAALRLKYRLAQTPKHDCKEQLKES
jgi:hypothetical protein